MNRILYVAIACLLLQACGGSDTKEPSKLDKVNWILGYWEMTTPEGTVTESWIRTSDTMYAGVGKFIDSAGNVLSTEEISLVLRGKELWYVPAVSNQNNGMPISFKETSFADTMVAFENKEHDFPKKIVYQKTSDNTILAYIEGDINGETQRIEYPYVKQ